MIVLNEKVVLQRQYTGIRSRHWLQLSHFRIFTSHRIWTQSFSFRCQLPSYKDQICSCLGTMNTRQLEKSKKKCPICLRLLHSFPHLKNKAFIVSCGCAFCGECIPAYFNIQINSGNTIIKCPNWRDEICTSTGVTDRELKLCVGNEQFTKLERFRRIKKDPNFRECQKCFSELKFNGKTLITCWKCKTESCFYHGNAHSGTLCDQYKTERAVENQSSVQLIAKTTRQCHWCGVNTEKDGGCDHMVSCVFNIYFTLKLQ